MFLRFSQIILSAECVGLRQRARSRLRKLFAQQHRPYAKQNQRRSLDFELLRAVVFEADNNHLYVALRAIGSFASRIPMSLSVAYR